MTTRSQEPADEVAAISALNAHHSTESSPLIPKGDQNSRPYVFAGYCFCFCLICLGSLITYVPMLEIYRYIICQDYYADSHDSKIINLIRFFDKGSSHDLCSIDDISRQVATFSGLMESMISIPATCLILLFGKLADKYGRKAPLYTAFTGYILSRAWIGLVLKYGSHWGLGINSLLPSSLIMGFGGGSPAIKMALYSITADCFSASGGQRLVANSWLAAGLQVSMALGPSIGSLLLVRRLMFPIYGELICAVLGLCILFFLPETHRHLDQTQTIEAVLTNDEAGLDKPSRLRSAIDVIKSSAESLMIFTRGRNFIILGITMFTNSVALVAMMIIVQMLNHELLWSMSKAGYFVSAVSFTKVFVFIVLLPLITKLALKRFGPRTWDLTLVQGGLALDVIAFAIYGLTKTITLLPVAGAFQALAAPGSMAMRVLISTLVPSEETGSLFAAFSMVEAGGEIMGNQGLSWIYARTLSTFPGFTCLVLSMTYGFSLICSLFFKVDRLIDHDI